MPAALPGVVQAGGVRRLNGPGPAGEIGRLRGVGNLALIAEIGKAAEGERKIEIPLPSDRDMDRVMSFLEQAWRRLVEMANRMQKDVSGKI